MGLKERFESRESSNKNSTAHLEKIITDNKEDIEYVIKHKISKKQFIDDIMEEFNGSIESGKIQFNTNNIFKILDKCKIKNKWNTKKKVKKDSANQEQSNNI